MRWLLALTLLATVASADDNAGRFHRFCRDRSSRGFLCDSEPFFSAFPASGAGTTTACSTTAPTGARGEVTTVTRTGATAECYSNDGQTLTQMAANVARVSSGRVDSTWLGIWHEDAAINSILNNRDLSTGSWTKTNMTCTKNAVGMRGAANSASTCTATAPNATVCQTLVFAAAARASSWHTKKVTLTGALTFARDGATYSADVASQQSTTLWKREVPAESPGCAGGNCVVIAGLAGSVLNPQVCMKLAASGDSVLVDFVQDESTTGTLAVATSPTETAGVAVARGAEAVSWPSVQVPATGGCAKLTVVPEYYASSGHVGYLLSFSGAPSFFANASSNAVRAYDGATFTDTPTWSAVAGATTTFLTRWGGTQKESVVTTDPFPYASGSFDGTMSGAAGLALGYTAPALGVVKGVVVDPDRTRCAGRVIDWMGDSIIRGLGSTPNTPPWALQTALGRVVVNYGVDGTTNVNGATSWNAARNVELAETLVWSFGTNDANAGTTGAAMLVTATAVWADAVSRGKRVVITGILPWKGIAGWTAGKQAEGDAYNAGALAWATANGQGYVSLASMGGEGGDPLALLAIYDSGDHLHPNAAGAAEIARLVAGGSP